LSPPSKADQARAFIIRFGRPPAVNLDHVCTSDKSGAGAGHSSGRRNAPMNWCIAPHAVTRSGSFGAA